MKQVVRCAVEGGGERSALDLDCAEKEPPAERFRPAQADRQFIEKKAGVGRPVRNGDAAGAVPVVGKVVVGESVAGKVLRSPGGAGV